MSAKTANLALNLTPFNNTTWHDEMHANFKIIDGALTAVTGLTGVNGLWLNSLAVVATSKYIDETDGTLWQVATSHTTHATDSFATDRANNPTYWTSVATGWTYRGAWGTLTTYNVGDIAYQTTEHVVGVCIAQHTSTTSIRADSVSWDFFADLKSAVDAAETAQTAAETAKTGAETAKTAAETAKTAAETAKTGAETAKTGAETAKTDAETAAASTDADVIAANSAAGAASISASDAATSAVDADTAKTGAEIARTGAETAETNALLAEANAAISAAAAALAVSSNDELYQNLRLIMMNQVANAALAVQGYVNAVVDMYEDETGISQSVINSTDLALSGTTTESGHYSSYPSPNLVDGNDTTYWWEYAATSFVTIDCLTSFVGMKVEIDWSNLGYFQQPGTVIVSGWDGSAWVELSNLTGLTLGSVGAYTQSIEFASNTVSYQKYKFDFDAAVAGTYAAYVVNTIRIFDGATGFSTNHTYDATGDFYHNAPAVVDAGVTAAMLSTVGLISFTAASLVDGLAGSVGFHTNTAPLGSTCDIDFGSGNAKEIVKWGFQIDTTSGSDIWDIQYSDDGASYTTASANWNLVGVAVGWHEVTWASVGAHRYWRAYKNNSPSSSSWTNEVKLYEQPAVLDMTLQSIVFTAAATPTTIFATMQYKPIDSVTMNTDVKMFVTINGTDWTVATMTKVADLADGVEMWEDSAVDVSGQTAGTDVAYKIETLNSKSVEIHGDVTSWKP